MNKRSVLFLLGVCCLQCSGREPFKPRDGSLPFLVYFLSRYRGICVGTLVSRTAVLTAAVCVTSPDASVKDTRPINVVAGTTYRHPRRGIRVQVLKILIPNLKNMPETRGYLMEKSVALLLLKRKIPDVLVEIPMRALDIDWKGEESLSLQEECLIPGWHFFYKGVRLVLHAYSYKHSLRWQIQVPYLKVEFHQCSALCGTLFSTDVSLGGLTHCFAAVDRQATSTAQDKIYPVNKFLLQRNLRAQFLNIVKKNLWCEALSIKFQKALSNFGLHGLFDQGSCMCVRDTDHSAQPCHGMYGAPVICRGRAVAMLMAPDAQWTNCTGYSNIVHLFSGRYLKDFMTCVSSLFDPEHKVEWSIMKKSVYEDYEDHEFDYVPEIYDRLLYSHSDSTSSDES